MTKNRLILLGTKGGPRLTTGTAWPSSSVLEVAGRPYIVDCGLGVTRQFVEAGYTLEDVHTILVTHLHSDHCLELGPLIHTTWVSSPIHKIKVFGPPGTEDAINCQLAASAVDIEIRMMDERQSDIRDMLSIHEFTEGEVFRDDLVEVSALTVVHPPFEHCYALKFRFEDKSVVFSADTCFHPPLAEFAKGADILVHEVMHMEGTERLCERVKEYKPALLQHMVAAHTTGEDAGRIATMAGVKHLVVNHFIPADDPTVGPGEFTEIVRKTWSGKLTIGHDLLSIEF